MILDYGNNIATHGPIDCLEAGEVRLIVCGSVKSNQEVDSCPEDRSEDGCEGEDPRNLAAPSAAPCGDTFSRALGACPHCGWKIPPQEVERVEAEERVKKMHEKEAAERAILGSMPEELAVNSVTLHRHKKAGKPDSVRVVYRCGIATFREWVCLDHEGFAGQKARQWWARRFGVADAKVATVDHALDGLFTATELASKTETITVVRKGKHSEIVGYKFRGVK